MIRLLVFEMKKIWYRRALILPIMLVGIVLIWLVAVGGTPVRLKLNGTFQSINTETCMFWGQTVTDELKTEVLKKARDLGALGKDPEEDPFYFTYTSLPVVERYGADSVEASLCSYWVTILHQPTFETEWEDYQAVHPERDIDPGSVAVWKVAPSESAWKLFLDSDYYPALLTGSGSLFLILLFLCDVFSREEAGDMRDIGLSAPQRKPWITAKICASALSGAMIVFFLYAGMLLLYGVFFGFYGWSIDATSLLGNGGSMGMLARPISACGLCFMKLGMLTVCGAFFGILTAAASAVLRKDLGGAGLVIVLIACMESLLYILIRFQNRIVSVWGWETYDRLTIAFMTPARWFLNTELLMMRAFHLESAYDELMALNILIRPSCFVIFLSVVSCFTAVSIALCHTYRTR